MAAIKLEPHQITRQGKYPAPNIPGYNSLFFHPLTKENEASKYPIWGTELKAICNKNNIDYYYFLNDMGVKINVYPNSLIEEWWGNRK